MSIPADVVEGYARAVHATHMARVGHMTLPWFDLPELTRAEYRKDAEAIAKSVGWPAMQSELQAMKEEKKQWEANWHDAADYDLCKDALNGVKVAPGKDSVAAKIVAMQARIAELTTELQGRSACDRAFTQDHQRVMGERDTARTEVGTLRKRVAELRKQADCGEGVSGCANMVRQCDRCRQMELAQELDQSRAEAEALRKRVADAEARADGMERAGAEQAARADRNAADCSSYRAQHRELVEAVKSTIERLNVLADPSKEQQWSAVMTELILSRHQLARAVAGAQPNKEPT